MAERAVRCGSVVNDTEISGGLGRDWIVGRGREYWGLVGKPGGEDGGDVLPLGGLGDGLPGEVRLGVDDGDEEREEGGVGRLGDGDELGEGAPDEVQDLRSS